MTKLLQGKIAIVTGAGDLEGLGASFARTLAEAGASVMIADKNEAGMSAVLAANAGQGLRVAGCPVDISDESSVAAMVASTVEAFGGVDILVNNAGLMGGPSLTSPLLDIPMVEWQRVFDINLTGTLLCCRAVTPSMKERGGGKIVNISSGGAYQPKSAYSITKLCIAGLTAILSDQLGKDKINVNAIAPGMVETRAGLGVLPPGSADRARQANILRPGTPSDLSGMLLLLTSASGDWITGQTFNVDGGWIKRI